MAGRRDRRPVVQNVKLAVMPTEMSTPLVYEVRMRSESPSGLRQTVWISGLVMFFALKNNWKFFP